MEKKPFYKRPITYILGGAGCLGLIIISFVLFVGLLFAIPTEDTEQAVEDEPKEEQEEKEDDKKESEKDDKQNDNPEKETKEATDDSIYEYTSFFEGEQTIEVNPGMVWSENSYFNTVYDSLDEVKKTFEENDEAESVMIMINAEMIDNKGNEELKPIITYRYTRETFDELNYDNFKDLALGEEWRILNEADAYFINPSLKDKVKDKYKDNLN